jgi:hypothetical protein
MGQGSSSNSGNEFIPLTTAFQELERLKFAQNLRKNPSDYAAYVNQRVDELSSEVFARKRAAFQKAQIDLGRYMDMDHNANFYKSRNADVDRLVTSIDENNKRITQSIAYDKDITKRQFEINEWYNYNKLETLFFLQLFFIVALSGAIVVFLQKNAIVTSALAGLLYVILAVVAGGTGLYRYYYTRNIRDPRLWHRRNFGTAEAPKAPAQCDKSGNIIFDVNSVIPKAATQCADDAAQRYDKWQENIQQEMSNYQSSGGATPPGSSAICSVKY